MSQFTVPVSDISKASWKSQAGPLEPLYPQLDSDLSGSGDPDYVYSGINPTDDSFIVKLDRNAIPIVGNSYVRIRLRKSDSGSIPTIVAIMKGGVSLATTNVTSMLGTTFDTFLWKLPHNVMPAIGSDWSDIRIRVTAGAIIPGSSGCGAMPTINLPFTYNGVINSSEQNWFRIAITSTDYVRLTLCISGGSAAGTIWSNSCPPDFDVANTGTVNQSDNCKCATTIFPLTTGNTYYLAITGLATGTQYSVAIAEGTC